VACEGLAALARDHRRTAQSWRCVEGISDGQRAQIVSEHEALAERIEAFSREISTPAAAPVEKSDAE
jgi:hypothetical protein